MMFELYKTQVRLSVIINTIINNRHSLIIFVISSEYHNHILQYITDIFLFVCHIPVLDSVEIDVVC